MKSIPPCKMVMKYLIIFFKEMDNDCDFVIRNSVYTYMSLKAETVKHIARNLIREIRKKHH